MTLHLIKLSVGSESVSDLEAWQQQRLAQKQRNGEPAELVHITRSMPKRAEELLAGGSIYWVIKGWICARQELVELRAITHNGMPHCGIIYAPAMIRVRPRQHRAFQGWRYLEGNDAPRDLPKGIDADDALTRELSELGLL